MNCHKARATHHICSKSVCEDCFNLLAGTPEGMKEREVDLAQRAKRTALAKTEEERVAALSDEERKAESDAESEKIKRQNATQDKYRSAEDIYRKHYKGE